MMVKGGNPMNHYEIEASVIRAKNGNREELLKILEQYKPFIFKTARDYNIKGYDTYDLAQIGYVSLINAVAKYRSGSNTFSSYAFNTIKNAFRYAARLNSKFNTELSLNEKVDNDAGMDIEFIDCIDSPENIEEDLIRREKILEVKRAVSKLPENELELVIMVYYSGASLATYAEKKGFSYHQAVRKKKKILEKLSKFIR
jgi:RNA polymerase sporulation-specific sigma factor